MKLSVPLALLSLAMVAVRVNGDLVLSDSDFNDSNWVVVEVIDTTPNDSFVFSGTQLLAGGNPGAYRQVINQLNTNTASSVLSGHFFQGGSFDPGEDGTFASIDVSVDGIGVSGPAGAMGYSFLLGQGGNYFSTGLGSLINGTGWHSLGATGLVESDFNSIGGGSLDLSNAGGPVTFGIGVSNGTFGLPSTNKGGVDNWSVTIHTVAIPEPSPLLIVGCVALIAGAGRYIRGLIAASR